MMPKAAKNQDSAAAAAAPPPAAAAAVERSSRPGKLQKLPVLLVTGDDLLWPQIGADLGADLVLKQLDGIDELVANIPAGQAAVVLWDARDQVDGTAVLSRLNLHSTRFAVVVLDIPASTGTWTLPLQHRQVIAHVSLPIIPSALSKALESAQDEVRARSALLGEGTQAAASVAATAVTKAPAKIIAVVIAIGAAVLLAGGYLLTRGGSTAPPSAAFPKQLQPQAQAQPQAAAGTAAEAPDEKVDVLMAQAQQAMNERHFIDPAAGSALALYREVLIVDPENGEARQGLQRLAEMMFVRLQSALDERKFDLALQFLETARSIDPNDRRLAALDERIAGVRAELGPAQIMAAVNAQNFERATQLIDEATRAKSLPPAKLAQLRDEVSRRRDDADASRLSKLIDARLQQDKLVDPRNDSAVYYLLQARQAGTSLAALQVQTQEALKRLTQMVHGAIEQRHLGDAERLLNEMQRLGAAAASTASLQHDLAAARAQSIPAKSDQPPYLELAQARLAQGKLAEPDGDNAVFYLNQLRSSDPGNPGLAPLAASVQAQLAERNAKLSQDAHVDGPRQVSEQNLTRLSKLEIEYPYGALKAGIEGWVELSFTVKADGAVSAVGVFDASPAGTFEAAAIKAVSRMKYKPVLEDGKPVAVTTQVRLIFRIPKK